jgi:hypothetical protein
LTAEIQVLSKVATFAPGRKVGAVRHVRGYASDGNFGCQPPPSRLPDTLVAEVTSETFRFISAGSPDQSWWSTEGS